MELQVSRNKATPFEENLRVLQEAAPAGFHRVADRRWVSEADGDIRRIVEFQALKGAQYVARWGFSVDFVPRLRGSRLAWKRTFATAEFDLCIDPLDAEGTVPHWCAFARDDSPRHVMKVARAVNDATSTDFAPIRTADDLLHLFERRSRMVFRRFGLENYVQTDLAWGLLQLAAGDVEAGSDRLTRFCERFEVDSGAAILAKAKVQAARLHSVAGAA